jgi:hypothetical protein
MKLKTSIYDAKSRKLKVQAEDLDDIFSKIDDIARHLEIVSFFWCESEKTFECFICYLLQGNEILIDIHKTLYYSLLDDFSPIEKETIKQAAKDYKSKFSPLKT